MHDSFLDSLRPVLKILNNEEVPIQHHKVMHIRLYYLEAVYWLLTGANLRFLLHFIQIN